MQARFRDPPHLAASLMTATIVLGCFFGYFALLLIIAWWTTRNDRTTSLQDFYLASHKAPWYVVAYGMVGTQISGVTFISVPGAVGALSGAGVVNGMGYFQVVLGYIVGYAVIAFVLMPIYYRLNLTSIYQYLGQRIGPNAYKAGALFFLLSRSTGAAARTYLMALVLQYLVADALGVPFWLTVTMILAQILIYTSRGGMKTLLWTDTLQSTCLIGAVIITVYIVLEALGGPAPALSRVFASDYGRIFFLDDWRAGNYFWKEFLSGAFICIVMTGLDQSQMQKNLSCKNIREAQWNMGSYTPAMMGVNFFLLLLGALLYLYVAQFGLTLPPKSDQLYPFLAFTHLGLLVAILFMLGLTAAAYSSADDALTAMTTSFTLDILHTDRLPEAQAQRIKRWTIIGFAALLVLIVLLLRASEALQTKDFSVIALVLKLAGYTYGPLLGMFAFGIATKRTTNDRLVPYVCLAAPLICLALDLLGAYVWHFSFGNALILVNGLLVFTGLWVLGNNTPKPALVITDAGQ